MAHPAVPGVIHFRLGFTIGQNTNCSSHVYYKHSASGMATSDLLNCANAMVAEWTTDLKPWHHSSVILTSIEAEDLGEPAVIPGVANVSVQGSRSGDTPFADCCALVNMKIARRYRGGKPRLYLPLLNAGDLADNAHWNETIRQSLQTQVKLFLVDHQGGQTPQLGDPALCSVGYIHAGSPLAVPNVDLVSGVTVNSIPGSQRRRMGR